MQNTPDPIAGIAPTTHIKIIKPFRWWKTWAIYLIPGAIIARIISPPSGPTAATQLGEIIGASAGAAALIALLACTAQMWALVAYYESAGQPSVYYSRLYGVSAVLFATAPFGIVISLPWALIYYFSRRRLVLKKIRELEGIPPIPPRPPGKVDYTWPLVAVAAAILIAAAIIYAASFNFHTARNRAETNTPVPNASPVTIARARAATKSLDDFDPNDLVFENDLKKMEDLSGSVFFESEEYGFNVYLPEEPVANERTLENGAKLPCFQCLGHGRTKGYLFEIIIQRTPNLDTSDAKTKSDYFRGVQNSARKLTGATGHFYDLDEVYDYLGTHKGKKYTATAPVGGVEMVREGRVFLENGKGYLFTVSAPKELWSDEAATAYLKTFRIK